MSFADVVQKTWAGNHLFSALIELTYRCNLDCYFCYNDVALEGKPLSREQYERLFGELAEMQVMNLVLSGGEPLAHPDFFHLGAKARELGFVVRVKSNGHALRGAVAKRLKDEVDPFAVEVSLHGATAETHDRQTRVRGSFHRLTANVREMVALGLRIKVNSTLTAWNEDELEAMMDLAEDLGVSLQVDPEVTPRDDGDATPLSISPSREATSRLFRIQAEGRRRALEVMREGDALLPAAGAGSGKHCGAGSATVAIDPFGTVYPCVQWRRAVGNLHDSSLREIWYSSASLESVREASFEIKEMVDGLGPEGALMGFCPGSAVMNTGNPMALYPAAATKLQLQRQEDVDRKAALLPVIR